MTVPSLIEVVLHPDRRKANPEPLDVSLRPVFLVGIVVWLVALGVSALLWWRGTIDSTSLWVCATGMLLGAGGYLWSRQKPGR